VIWAAPEYARLPIFTVKFHKRSFTFIRYAAHAAATLRSIRSVWVEDLQAIVEDNRIVKYRLTAKISFVVEEGYHHATP
jgi:hypothetical protein